MANGSTVRERLARLESELPRLREDMERLYGKARALEPLQAEVAKLLAWREKINGRARNCARVALWVGVIVLSQHVSAPWSDAVKQLGRALR